MPAQETRRGHNGVLLSKSHASPLQTVPPLEYHSPGAYESVELASGQLRTHQRAGVFEDRDDISNRHGPGRQRTHSKRGVVQETVPTSIQVAFDPRAGQVGSCGRSSRPIRNIA